MRPTDAELEQHVTDEMRRRDWAKSWRGRLFVAFWTLVYRIKARLETIAKRLSPPIILPQKQPIFRSDITAEYINSDEGWAEQKDNVVICYAKRGDVTVSERVPLHVVKDEASATQYFAEVSKRLRKELDLKTGVTVQRKQVSRNERRVRGLQPKRALLPKRKAKHEQARSIGDASAAGSG
jgi:hypothetical protein